MKKLINLLVIAVTLSKSLKVKYTVPYACDLGYLGDKFHINLIHRRNKKDLVEMIKKKKN